MKKSELFLIDTEVGELEFWEEIDEKLKISVLHIQTCENTDFEQFDEDFNFWEIEDEVYRQIVDSCNGGLFAYGTEIGQMTDAGIFAFNMNGISNNVYSDIEFYQITGFLNKLKKNSEVEFRNVSGWTYSDLEELIYPNEDEYTEQDEIDAKNTLAEQNHDYETFCR